MNIALTEKSGVTSFKITKQAAQEGQWQPPNYSVTYFYPSPLKTLIKRQDIGWERDRASKVQHPYRTLGRQAVVVFVTPPNWGKNRPVPDI